MSRLKLIEILCDCPDLNDFFLCGMFQTGNNIYGVKSDSVLVSDEVQISGIASNTCC